MDSFTDAWERKPSPKARGLPSIGSVIVIPSKSRHRCGRSVILPLSTALGQFPPPRARKRPLGVAVVVPPGGSALVKLGTEVLYDEQVPEVEHEKSIGVHARPISFVRRGVWPGGRCGAMSACDGRAGERERCGRQRGEPRCPIEWTRATAPRRHVRL